MPSESYEKLKVELVTLYKEMSDLTSLECRDSCRKPRSCCDPEYCALTISWAKAKWGIVLETTNDPTLPLMGLTGCTAAPHLRPNCTLHTCSVNSLGAKIGDETWNRRYFRLRSKIEKAEYKRDTCKVKP